MTSLARPTAALLGLLLAASPAAARAADPGLAQPAATEAKPAAEPAPSLEVKPPEKSAADLALTATVPEVKPGKSKALGWSAVGAGVLAVGLGGFAVVEGLAAKSKYDKAAGLLQPDGAIKMDASVAQYDQFVSEGDSAKRMGYATGGAAIGCAVLSGVLGYLSYRQTGEIGPIRF